ncbi:MAG: DUF2608 domain-containing protein [Pseudomonadota bacterium]
MNFKNVFALTVSLIGGFSKSFVAFAEIREVKAMYEVSTSIPSGGVVVFDLDNTVLEAKQTLGTDQFFTYLVKKAEEAGLRGQEAKDLALIQSADIQPISPVRLVERSTLGFLRSLQERNVTVFALTARPFAWAKGTLNQLASLQVDFSKTAPRIPKDTNRSLKEWSYQGGVIFLQPGQDKGNALVNFLNSSDQKPKKIVFIDDKPHNVKSVETALNDAGIENVEFRYGAADERVKNFDSQLANFEFHYFLLHKVFLDDEKAKELLSNK